MLAVLGVLMVTQEQEIVKVGSIKITQPATLTA